MQHCSEGKKFSLRELRVIAEGEMLELNRRIVETT